MFLYKHAETIEYVKNQPTFYEKTQTLRVNNSRILTIKNAKFSGYYVYINLYIWEDFQICIRVPLRKGAVENTSGLSGIQNMFWKSSW